MRDISCDQCCAAMINGVYCHELGCPNRHKVKIDGEWVSPDDDSDDPTSLDYESDQFTMEAQCFLKRIKK